MRKSVSAIVLVALVVLVGTELGSRGGTAGAKGLRTSITNSEGDIYASDIGSGVLRKLTPADRVDTFPLISPDGRRLAFRSISRAHMNDPGPQGVLSVMRSDGSHFQTVAPTGYQLTYLAWSPDGRSLTLGSYRRGGQYNLATRRVDALNLPLDVGGVPIDLQWSLEWRLGYTEVRGDSSVTVVVGRNGKELWRTSGSFGGWAPDGRKLAVIRHPTRTVLVMDHLGRRLMSFRSGGPGWSELSWAPDSKAIAFVRGKPSVLWVAQLRDGSTHRIGAASEWAPSWSTDSRKLAYVASGGAQSEIAVSAISRPRPRIVPQSIDMLPLAWTLDQRLVVRHSRYAAERQEFEAVPPAGGRATVLASFPVNAQVTAQMTPDRRTVILFHAYR